MDETGIIAKLSYPLSIGGCDHCKRWDGIARPGPRIGQGPVGLAGLLMAQLQS